MNTVEQFTKDHYIHFRRIVFQNHEKSQALEAMNACLVRVCSKEYPDAQVWCVDPKSFLVIVGSRAVYWTLQEYFPNFVRIRTDLFLFDEAEHERIEASGATLLTCENGQVGELTITPAELEGFTDFFVEFTKDPTAAVPVKLINGSTFGTYEWSVTARPLYDAVQKATWIEARPWDTLTAPRIAAELEGLS